MTLRVLLAKAIAKDLKINQINVDIAFLNLNLKEKVYIEISNYFYLLNSNINYIRKCL